jgi:hypothetical protein
MEVKLRCRRRAQELERRVLTGIAVDERPGATWRIDGTVKDLEWVPGSHS